MGGIRHPLRCAGRICGHTFLSVHGPRHARPHKKSVAYFPASMTREIVTQQGGYVTVESQVGKGSAFSIFLPR